MISKKAFIAVAVALTVTGFSVSSAIGWHDRGARSQAAWVFKAHNLGELSAHADAIVLARAGASFHSRFAFSDNGEDCLPFEITDFTVLRSIRGAAPESVIQVERAGGLDADGVTQHVVDADGGAFEEGATYFMFLKQQEQGPHYYQLNEQARFQVRGDRLAAVDEDDPVTQLLHGTRVIDALARVEQSTH